MFEIREEQQEALDKAAQDQYHQRLANFLRETLPDRTADLDDDALLGRILEGERKAATYGIVTERGVAQFVGLSLVAGPKFDEIPEVQKFLKHPVIYPHHKMDVFVDYLAKLESERGMG